MGYGASRLTTLAAQISVLLNLDLTEASHPGVQFLAQVYSRYPLSNDGYNAAAQKISRGVIFAKSIDDFLERHSNDELMQRVGKAAIAKCILGAEVRPAASLRI